MDTTPFEITSDDLERAARVFGWHFTEEERALMLEGLRQWQQFYRVLLQNPPDNAIPPAFRFDPELLERVSFPEPTPSSMPLFASSSAQEPIEDETLAFASLRELAGWIRAGHISAVQLTEYYLERLKRYDPLLHCVITLMPERALEEARRADEALRAGEDWGPLHGIPWGAKDLLATPGYPTTWGAAPYREQQFDAEATVVTRLRQAGAVLLAKLSMGELAWGDVWFGGQTRTPWNPDIGSSGSSAGSAAAVAAGLVGFSIGSETWGSIVSPAARNGITGLRPTFGRVSRHGAMALSWTMDKIGPLCRTAEDCAWVFAAIQGPDPLDPTTVQRPFAWPWDVDLKHVRLGYLVDDFGENYRGWENDQQALQVFRSLGLELVPIRLPGYPIEALQIILFVEAAAAFQALVLSHEDALLVRQGAEGWPNFFRMAHFVPAVMYVQAQRVRTQLMSAMASLFQHVDAYVAPSLEGDNLLLTNLTGHPALVLPTGLAEDELPTSITLIGRLYDEALILTLGHAFQQATDFHRWHPHKMGNGERETGISDQ